MAGIDVGGTKTLCLLRSKGREEVKRFTTPKKWEKLVDALQLWVEETEPEFLGIALPSPIRGRGIAEQAPNLGWDKKDVWKVFGGWATRVKILNDVTAAAIAEKYAGDAKKMSDFLCIYIGTGIGGGGYANGRLITGAFGRGMEVGHQQVDPDGMPCTCGARGCWETLAGTAGFLRIAEGIGLGGFSPPKLFELARKGNPKAQKLLNIYTDFVAIGVANLVAILDPSAIFFGGGLMKSWRLFSAPLSDRIRRRVKIFSTRKLQILHSRLGDKAVALGALIAAQHEDVL